MFIEERHKEILHLLQIHGKVMVKDLAKRYDVSEDCIRKDLKVLETQGQCKRAYGGAILKESHSELKAYEHRVHLYQEEKKIIAQKAYDLIEEHDVVFLDTSSTNLALAELIAQGTKSMSVVTNMIDILETLSSHSHVTLLCVGGLYNHTCRAFHGAETNRQISQYRFDKAFIGSVGLHIDTGDIATYELEDGITKYTAIHHAKQAYLVMEAHKFNFDGNYKFASLQDIQGIITNEPPVKEIQTALQEYEITIL